MSIWALLIRILMTILCSILAVSVVIFYFQAEIDFFKRIAHSIKCLFNKLKRIKK